MASYPIPVDLAIGLMLATELEHPLLVPYVSHSRPRGLTSDESMLQAAALAFLQSLWRATRSSNPMQVWRVERWLREHRLTIAQFREFLAREKAVQHSIEDIMDGRVKIPGRPFFLVYATGIELWSWPAGARHRFREDTQGPGAPWVNNMTRRRGPTSVIARQFGGRTDAGKTEAQS